MNWTRALIAGVVGGIVLNVADFVMHGLILGNTYTKYEVFSQEQTSPLYFSLIAIVIGIMAALLFARTRTVWGAGFMGGAQFGLLVGLIFFFDNFYFPLVLEGFPYYLGWCWGGVDLIGFVVLGAVLGAIYKKG